MTPRVVAAGRRLTAAVRSPACTWLALRILGWSAVLPALKAWVPLERLVRLMWVQPPPGRRRDLDRERRVRRLSRLAAGAVRLGRPGNCLERSLIAYRHLAAAAADPVLVIGVRPGADGTEGHVWVLLDGEPVHDSPEEIATYTPVTTFHGGRRQLAG